MKIYILLISLHLSFGTLGAKTCKEEHDYQAFYDLKKSLEDKKEKNEKIYSVLKNKLNELEVCHEKPMNDIYIIRSKIYSYKVNGNETRASVIYDCDNMSTKNVCLKDNRIDWDWTERIYPRSSSKLRRPIPESNQEMEFPFSVGGFELTNITLTYINVLGSKEHKNIEYYKKSNNYVYAIVNIRDLFYENIITNDQFSNCWLVSIYKSTTGKYLKVIWYYAGSNFLEDKTSTNNNE